MKKFLSFIIATTLLVMSFASLSYADNPIVQTIFTSDPAPMVYNDTVYVYTGHDEDDSKYFTMNDWRCYSTKDMVNWTDHGAMLSYKTFSWAKGDAWAAHCIERDGKFYYYVTLSDRKQGSRAIGVAVSDSPTGPFKDAIGQPLIAPNWSYIDPAAFIDDDGQAYLYWGNPNLYYVKLNKDMVSYDKSVGIVKVPLTEEGFGKRVGNKDRATLYEEAPWLYKRNGLYYMIYAAGGVPENISYSTSTSPTGPWTYKGVIMPKQGSSFTNHPGVIDFKGKSYFFYHNGALPKGGGFTRSVCVEEFQFNADGSFPTINMSKNGPEKINNLNPYVRNEAETIAWESGIETEACSKGGMNVYDINAGDYIKVSNVDFGTKGASTFSANVSSSIDGGTIELRLDTVLGKSIGTLSVPNTGGMDNWKVETTNVTDATGVHDLYLLFRGGSGDNLFKFDHWKFNNSELNDNSNNTGIDTNANTVIAIKKIAVDKKTISLIVGKSTTLKATITPSNATNKELIWKSSNTKVVKVNKNGRITAIAPGSATITLTTKDGKFTTTCKVKVKKK